MSKGTKKLQKRPNAKKQSKLGFCFHNSVSSIDLTPSKARLSGPRALPFRPSSDARRDESSRSKTSSQRDGGNEQAVSDLWSHGIDHALLATLPTLGEEPFLTLNFDEDELELWPHGIDHALLATLPTLGDEPFLTANFEEDENQFKIVQETVSKSSAIGSIDELWPAEPTESKEQKVGGDRFWALLSTPFKPKKVSTAQQKNASLMPIVMSSTSEMVPNRANQAFPIPQGARITDMPDNMLKRMNSTPNRLDTEWIPSRHQRVPASNSFNINHPRRASWIVTPDEDREQWDSVLGRWVPYTAPTPPPR